MQFFGNAGGVLWNLSWKDPSDLKKIMIKITSKIKKDRKGVPTNFSENLYNMSKICGDTPAIL